jgi:hypothetical protein
MSLPVVEPVYLNDRRTEHYAPPFYGLRGDEPRPLTLCGLPASWWYSGHPAREPSIATPRLCRRCARLVAHYRIIRA